VDIRVAAVRAVLFVHNVHVVPYVRKVPVDVADAVDDVDQ